MNDFLILEYETPFQPSNPVRPENFKGRKEIIKKILRYTPNALKGEAQHFFLAGKKGMGKTSISDFVQNYLSDKYNMACAYTSNKGNDSVSVLASNILISLLDNVPEESRIDKLKTWFGNHVSQVGIVGTKIRFDVNKEEQDFIKKDFFVSLNLVYEDLKEYYNGLFIVIDDINGLSKSREFVDWYKRLADTIFVNKNYNIPVYFLLAGYPEKFDDLVDIERSFGRIFYYAEVEELNDSEVKEFFNDTFKSTNLTVNNDALNIMTKYSLGVPLTMQQIGDSTFWNVSSNIVTLEDAKKGILQAADELAYRQIRRTLNILKATRHEKTLIKLVSNNLHQFEKSQLIELLNNEEEYDEFIDIMLKYNILTRMDALNDEIYEFNDKIIFTYYTIKTSEQEINQL